LENFRIKYGTAMVATLRMAHVNRVLDQMADGPAAANNLRDRLNVLMAFAVADGWRPDNPVISAKRVKQRPSKGFRTRTEDDIEVFRKRWSFGTPQRLAIEILLHTGLRRSDAVRLGRCHIQGDTLVIATMKS
jgi:integrase